MSVATTPGIPASRRGVLRGLATAAAMTIVTLAAARLPHGVPSGGLDSSWASVLRYASARGLEFGTDVVFTYGPLGYAVTGGFSGGDVVHVRWVNLFLMLACVAPIVLVARRLPWQAGGALLLLVACLPLMFAAGTDGLVQAGLCCWGLLGFLPHEGRGARGRLDATLLLALAASVALIGLAKFSWLVAGAATVCAVAIDAWLRGSRVRACMTVGVTAGLWLAGWVALGQPVENVAAYLTGALQIAAGYARAMGTRGDNDILVLAMLITGACAAGVVIRGRAADLPEATHLRTRRWLLVAWLLGMLFIGWKHGIVRAANRDTHVTALVAQCVVLAFALPIIPVVPAGADRAGGVRGWLVAAGIDPSACWHWGFGAAGVGMTFGMWVYIRRLSWLGRVGAPPTHGRRPWGRLAVVAAGTAALGLTLSFASSAHWVVPALCALTVAGTVWLGLVRKDAESRRLAAVLIFFLAATLFWAIFEQTGTTLTLFADDLTRNEAFGEAFPSSWWQSVNALLVMALAPAFAWGWMRLGRRQPSVPAKFSLGLVFLGLSFALMVPAASATAAGKVGPEWLLSVYLLQTVGEMCLSPVGLSTMTKLAPARLTSMILGVWFLATAIGSKLAGSLGGEFTANDPAAMRAFFLEQTLVVAAMAAVLLILTPWIRRLMEAR